MENGELYVPSVVIDEHGPIIRLKCLTRPLTPSLDPNDQDHQRRISFRERKLPIDP
jgi:hypothetical protein